MLRLTSCMGGLLLAMLAVLPFDAAAITEPNRDSVVDPALTRIDEAKHLGKPLDASVVLVDSAGREFTVGEMLGKPLILLPSYYSCDGTCPTMNRNLAQALQGVTRFHLGQDYRVLTVSFDRHDTPQSAAAFLAKAQAIPAAMRDGWRHAVFKEFAGGDGALVSGVGFRYFWSNADKMFLHSNVLVFITPEGRVARYIYGTRMDARNIELALIDADWGRISSTAALFDMMTGACFSYNYAEGRYQPNYSLIAGGGSLLLGVGLTVSGLTIFRKRVPKEPI